MLPDFTTTSRAKPWHHVGHRTLRPFTQPSGQPWCTACQQHVDTEREARFESTVYAHKEWCKRCGAVVSHGVYNQAHDPAVGRRAMQWAQTPEEITR